MQDMYDVNWKQNPFNASQKDFFTNLQNEPKADCLADRLSDRLTDKHIYRQTDQLTELKLTF